MTPEALKALKASIVKWEANERAETWEDIRLGIVDCPLCKLYHDFYTGLQGDKERCAGCPVKERTKKDGCVGTPYADADEEWIGWASENGTREAFRAAAHAETEFLRSLLPEGETV